MAALRNTATNLARLAGHDNIAAAQRTAAWHPTAVTDALKRRMITGRVRRPVRPFLTLTQPWRAHPEALPLLAEWTDEAHAVLTVPVTPGKYAWRHRDPAIRVERSPRDR